jgi:AhpD family alkylhydroperoxidase
MGASAGEFYEGWSSSMVKMKGAAPEIGRGFGAMFGAIMKEGALQVREKELIALAISVTMRCEACIYSHVEKCLKHGATREQVLEAAGVGVVMQGGPAYTYVPKVVEALDYFAARA